MQIQATLNTSQGIGFAGTSAVRSGSGLGGLDFESMLGQMAAPVRQEPIRPPNDWRELPGGDTSALMGVGIKPLGNYSAMERAALDKIKEGYVGLLPQFGNIEFGPPIANFDPRIELLRLARVEYKVRAMEEAGEIDKALDAFIGIHGLKDRLTVEEKAELRERLLTIAKATLLEEEWQKAYLGAMKTRLDVSIEGQRMYLLGEGGDVATREVNEALPYGDPDLLSFTRHPQWQNIKVDPQEIRAAATEMLAAELARQAAEALAIEQSANASA